jgi:hypothetical protein
MITPSDPVKEKTLIPVIQVETEIPMNPTPKTSIEPEVPVVDEPENEVITPSTIYTITITNETGSVITTLNVEEGYLITTSSLELPENFKGFFLDEQTCEDEPFDLDTPITEDLTLIQASFNDQAPCIQLDYIVLNGRPVAGSTLSVDVFPLGANVTISWYTSVNNRTYREIPGETESTFTVRPEDSGKFIRVYVVSDSNPPVVRYDTIKLDVFSRVSGQSLLTPEEQVSATAIIATGSIPIAFPEDLQAIASNDEHNFAGFFVTEGGLSKSYVLIRDIDLSSYTNITQNFIPGVFTGTFDGKGFMISNFTLTTSEINSGLFHEMSNATFKNFTLNHFSVTSSKRFSALLVARATGTNSLSNITITNSSLTSTTCSGCDKSEVLIGALIAVVVHSPLTTLTEITQGASVSANQLFAGGFIGLVGDTSNVKIESSTNAGNISAGGNAGAFVGKDSTKIGYNITISSSTNTGTLLEGTTEVNKDIGGS